MPGRTSAIPYLLVLVTGTLWGATFSLARMAAETGAHPLGLTWWQVVAGALALLGACAVAGQWPRFTREEMFHYLVIAVLGSAVPGALYFYAAPHVPAGILAITIALVPMLIYAMAWCMSLEAYVARRAFGLGLGLAAVVVLMVPESSLPDRTMVRWLLLALLASVFYAAESVYVDWRVPKRASVLALLTGALIVAGVLLTPVVAARQAFVVLSLDAGRLEFAVIAMAVLSSAAYCIYLWVLQRWGPVFASQTGYVTTLTGVLWGMLIFAERHSLWVWLALAMILVGMALVTPRRAAGPDTKAL